MKRIAIINPLYKADKANFDDFITNFETKGEDFGNQDRNSLKLFELNGTTVNIKSFKKPNIINQIVYRFFRKSKAQRSFEYANKLLELNILTPKPIGYYEFTEGLLFKNSYYISAQQYCDLTYRKLTTNLDLEQHETILRAFTRFTHDLHVKGVHFLDHSPGNTLIESHDDGYHFYLVDLNRMEFGPLDFETRIKNFSKLTIHKFMIEIMSNEYAKCSGEDETKIFNLMWESTRAFQEKFYRKVRLKKRIFFWKKKYKNRVSQSPL